MKKIAVQLFGHLRSFKQTYKSFKKNVIEANMLTGYAIDLFIHTWTETDHSTIAHHNKDGKKRGFQVSGAIRQEIQDYYKPTDLLIEPQLIPVQDFVLTEKIQRVPRAFSGILNATYTVYKTSAMRRDYAKKNDVVYDYVILTRPDVQFHNPFDIDNFLSAYKKNNFPVPSNGLFFAYSMFGKGWIEDRNFIAGSDILYFGSVSAIDKATNLYCKISDCTFVAENLKNEFCSFESMWFNYWLDNGLEPIRLDYAQFEYFSHKSFSIVRPPSFFKSNKIYRNKAFILIIKRIIRYVMPYGLLLLFTKIIRKRRFL